MGFAVLHTKKGKGGSGGIGKHIDRDESYKHTYRQADPNRLHLNQDFTAKKFKDISLSEAVEKRIKEGYNGKRKIRSDSVRFATHILTGSHEDMKRIFADKNKAEKWIKANYDFISKEFGKENIVRFTLHMDEKTPHIHAVTVPLTEDGRLSAKEVLGNPKAFEQRQTDYAEAMKPFNLERGLKRKGVKHEDAKAYYARLNKALKEGFPNDRGIKNALGIVTKEKLKEALKTAQIALNELKAKIRTDEAIKGFTIDEQKRVIQEKEKVKALQKELKENAFNPEILRNYRNLESKKAWNKMANGILFSEEAVTITDVDELIRVEMKKMNPDKNPWASFRESYGNDGEKRLHLVMKQHNENLKKQQQERKNQRENQSRGRSL